MKSSAELYVLPKRFTLSYSKLHKMHTAGHRPADRLYDVIRLAMTDDERTDEKYVESLKHIQFALEYIVKKCKGCQLHRPVASRATTIPTIREFNEKVWIDVFALTTEYFVLGILCDGTREIALVLMVDATASDIITAIEERWTSLRGLPRSITSDNGRAFTSAEFLSWTSENGIFFIPHPRSTVTPTGQ